MDELSGEKPKVEDKKHKSMKDVIKEKMAKGELTGEKKAKPVYPKAEPGEASVSININIGKA